MTHFALRLYPGNQTFHARFTCDFVAAHISHEMSDRQLFIKDAPRSLLGTCAAWSSVCHGGHPMFHMVLWALEVLVSAWLPIRGSL